jgi:predicted DCC family thiol-disulfide oxidoreductase YuxK
MHMDKAVIIYDGACSFCRQAIEAIRARDRDGRFVYLPRDTPGIEQQYLGLKVGDFNTGMRLFEPDGTMHIGTEAIYRITLRLPHFRWFSWIYRLPLLNVVIRRVYTWIAANRLKLARHCNDQCEIDISESGPGKSTFRHRIAVSILILVILGLHGWANIAKAVIPSSKMGDRLWPFLAYGMYRNSRQPGTIRTTKHHLFAVTARGRELKVVPELVGMYGPALNRHYLRPMLGGNPSAPRLLAERINRGREDPVVEFRIDSEIFVIAEAGVVLEGKQSVSYPAGS